MGQHLSTHDSAATDYEPVVERRSKKTARWCKGKKGREHKPGPIELRHNAMSAGCRWFSWAIYGRPEDVHWRYSCEHSIRCTACDKYLEYFLVDRSRCPDYKAVPDDES